jgi:hypothetical protein
MSADGFRLAACDGVLPQGGLWNGLPSTPTLEGIRPDACGVAAATGEFAFGEAKTDHDIATLHTVKQLRILARLIHRNPAVFRLYIAVPRSAARTLDCVLCQVGLQASRQVVRLDIPDCFLTENVHERH